MIRNKMCLLMALIISVGSVSAQPTGILREYWTNLPGLEISDLRSSSLYPCNPTGYTIQNSFSVPVNWADNYASRLRGFVTAPASGNYKFWISGDDKCELWLSNDETSVRKRLIAKVTNWTLEQEWTKYSEQCSENIYLEAGKRYYIEAIHKEGDQADHIAVGWKLPNGVMERPIGNSRLTSWPIQENYSNWTYNTPIWFNTTSTGANVNEDIINFPVLIQIGSEHATIFQQALPNGADIRFSDPDGTQLNFEIANWNSSLKKATIWVKVPRITGASNQDHIIMYWGKSDALLKSDPSAVFTIANSFYNVWHLDDDLASADLADATGKFNGAKLENNGAQENTSVRSTEGIINKSLDFCGSNRIPLYNYIPAQNNDFTISAWVKPDQITNIRSIWYTNETNSYGKIRAYSGNGNWEYENGNGTETKKLSTPAVLSTWVHLDVVQKLGGNIEFYVNGVLKGSEQCISKGNRAVNSFIGAEEWSNYFDGKIDEFIFSNTARNANWLKLSYENQKPSQQFLMIGSSVINAPSNFTASTLNETDIVLNWNDNSTNENGFILSKKVGTSLPIIITNIEANVTSYIDKVGTCNVKSVYMIKAVNNYSESPIVESNEISIKPCPPDNLIAKQVTNTEIRITWTGVSDEFSLEGKLLPNNNFTELYKGPNLDYLHQGIQCQSSWVYRVRSSNHGGSSNYSNEISINTSTCAIEAPQNLKIDNSVSDQITLSWDDVSSNEDGFRIYRKKEGESTFSEIGTAPATSGDGIYVDNTIICNMSYSYYVITFNSSSTSGASNIVSARSLYCGAGKPTSEMISIVGMYIDNLNRPCNGKKMAYVKIFTGTDVTLTPVYEEAFNDIEIKNGYFTIPLGLTNDVAKIVRSYNSLYYDVIIDGVSIYNSKAKPLMASPYSVKNSFNLAGNGSPLTNGNLAPVGATYVDMLGQVLYVKYGSGNKEWKKVGN